MKTEMTPGPWATNDFGEIVCVANGFVIARIPMANARLRGKEAQEELAGRRANRTAIAALPELLDDLREASATLRRYEVSHRAKNTEESTAKAEVNAALATRFETTIAKATGTAP